MFGSAFRGANAYAQVGLETQVVAASPHKLITLLFDGAMTAITNAIRQMSEEDVAAKGKSISHAILIIESGLKGALNIKAGGEIAANLEALYEYMGQRLLQANLENNQEKLKEVHRLLGELKSAWESIDPTRQPHVSMEQNEDTSILDIPPTMTQRFAQVAA